MENCKNKGKELRNFNDFIETYENNREALTEPMGDIYKTYNLFDLQLFQLVEDIYNENSDAQSTELSGDEFVWES